LTWEIATNDSPDEKSFCPRSITTSSSVRPWLLCMVIAQAKVSGSCSWESWFLDLSRAVHCTRTYGLQLLYVNYGYHTMSPPARYLLVWVWYGFVPYQLWHYGSKWPTSAIWLATLGFPYKASDNPPNNIATHNHHRSSTSNTASLPPFSPSQHHIPSMNSGLDYCDVVSQGDPFT
jgi:hypothetical protein